MALAVTHNYLDQFIPVTPVEHTLVHQLIHLELRFLQMQYLYDQALICRVDDFLRTPVPTIPLILRELDRLPNRMQKVLKLLRQELAFRDEKTEIEVIPGHPKLPALPDNAYYRVVLTDDGAVPVQAFDETKKIETNPNGSSDTGPFGLTGKEIFHEFCKTIMMGYDAQPKDIEKERNEANEEASRESTLEARSEPIAA